MNGDARDGLVLSVVLITAKIPAQRSHPHVNNQLGRPVALNEGEQGRRMRWWAVRFVRELPPVTVEAPGVWHRCGTDDPLPGVTVRFQTTPL